MLSEIWVVVATMAYAAHMLYMLSAVYAIGYMLYAICYMLYAICYMLTANCYMLYATCYTLYATCYMLYAICYMLYAICYMLYTIFSVECLRHVWRDCELYDYYDASLAYAALQRSSGHTMCDFIPTFCLVA